MPGSGPKTPVSPPTVDPQLLVDPIGFLRTETYRQRVACNTLEALASAGANGDVRTDAERVLHYIVEDLPGHLRDLEECLFPLLRQRSHPADDVERLLARYRGRRDEPNGTLLAILESIVRGDPPPPDLAAAARTNVELWRSDLVSENDEILPLAERRMTDADLVALGQAMALRRGNSRPN